MSRAPSTPAILGAVGAPGARSMRNRHSTFPRATPAAHTGRMSGLRVVLAGAAIGNGNRGVEALGRSVADAVERNAPDSIVSVLDDGWGTRPDVVVGPGGPGWHGGRSTVEYVGVRRSRRWYRPESWAQVRCAQAVGPWANPVARRIARADAVLDLSAGDSFTDLYGPGRLESVSAPKRAALRARRPLVLLPQTYGPFTTIAGRRLAERLVRAATLAYARDGWSYDRLLELAGPDADADRLRRGVDVAFALEPRRPPAEVAILLERLAGNAVAGVNVSGLLHGPAAAGRFGLAGDYLATMTDLIRALIARGAHVVLVPHVHLPGGRGESDVTAIAAVRSALSDAERRRTTVLPAELDAAQLKWCIGRLDWFAGSRMHATIGALSSLVPAYAYAYSDKARGVFETCGMGDQVGDARALTGSAAVAAMTAAFDARASTGAALSEAAPAVIRRSHEQLREVLDDVRQWQQGPATARAIA
ncbi:hypothetical protein GCE65_02415 [Pseudactinotalea sp. HY158]|nr:hypothetical protein GCE65_02415 [Pseudactinotalea sp. HY158]